MLILEGTINENFNFELFKNLSSRLMALYLCINNEDDISHKLLDGHQFSNLQVLRFCFMGCTMRRVNKEFLSQFPMLVELRMEACNLEMIEDDAFSNSKNLVRLHLSYNFLETLDKPVFSYLINLEELMLSNNILKRVDKNVFSGLQKLRILDLSNNRLSLLDPKSFRGLPDSIEIRLEDNIIR